MPLVKLQPHPLNYPTDLTSIPTWTDAAPWLWDSDVVLCITGDLLLIKCLQFTVHGQTRSPIGLFACELGQMARAAAKG